MAAPKKTKSGKASVSPSKSAAQEVAAGPASTANPTLATQGTLDAAQEKLLASVTKPTALLDGLDPLSTEEKSDFDGRREEVELEGLKQDIEARKTYANKIFLLIALWLGAVFVVIFFQGLHAWKFWLSDAVIIALISGTTVNVLGLFVVVINYLFYREKK